MTEKLCVIGLGYVGLPLACVLASKGYKVLGIDVNKETVNNTNNRKTVIIEKDLEKILSEVVTLKNLYAKTDFLLAKEYTKFIICTPTPLDENGKPNLNYLFSACKSLSEFLKKGDLIIIESSVPPGTIEKVLEIFEKNTGFKRGNDFFLAHCPERIFPGNVIFEIINNDRVIAGINKKSLEMTLKLYKSFSKGKLLTTTIKAAELVKLVENVYRDVNIALSNELALICEALDVDVKEIIKLANSHPRVNFLDPGCGVGGSCIPKDPVLLFNICKEHGFEPKILKSSREINKSMPKYFVKKIIDNIGNGKGKNALILGLAYKGNVSDTRDSPAEVIIKELKNYGFNLFAYDPLVKQTDGVKMIKSLENLNLNFDLIVLVTNHDQFKSMDLNKLKNLGNKNTLIADGRRIFDRKKIEKLGFRYIGIGI